MKRMLDLGTDAGLSLLDLEQQRFHRTVVHLLDGATLGGNTAPGIRGILFFPQMLPHAGVQGEGSFYIASPDYLKALRALCDEHGILLIADEVQSGFARTGKLFVLEHSGIEADILTTAKSLANGMPLSAVVGTAKVMDASGPNSLGGTYSGNPLSCAAALAVIDAIEEENILARSEQMGNMLAERFAAWEERFPAVAHGRQLGAMAAFELLNGDGEPDPQLTAALCAKAREKGLILLSCGFYGNSIRILVPLTVSSAVLEEGLSIIEQSLEALC